MNHHPADEYVVPRVAWVPYWTAFLENDADPLDANWYVEVYGDGCWKIQNWLGEDKATGQAKSAGAAKIKTLGAFAHFVKWHKAAMFTGPHLGHPMRLCVQLDRVGYRWQTSLLGKTDLSTAYLVGNARTLVEAKAAAEAAAPNVIAAANRDAEKKQ